MTDSRSQVFHPYTAWEDYQAGMWSLPVDGTTQGRAVAILGDPERFLRAARRMLRDWPLAAEHNLTDRSQNRRAWVGQATCCHEDRVPESETRAAWWLLSTEQQTAANAVADKVIEEWERYWSEECEPSLFSLHDDTRPDAYM